MSTREPVRWRAVRLAVLALAALALVAAIYTIATTVPTRNSIYPKCVAFSATGFNCAGCGTGRAAHLMLNGHPLAALQCNAFAPFYLPIAIFAGFRYLTRWAIGIPHPPRRLSRAFWIWLLIAGLLLYTVVRNIPVEPFTYLAPREIEAPAEP